MRRDRLHRVHAVVLLGAILSLSALAIAQDASVEPRDTSEVSRLAHRIERVREDRGHAAAEDALAHASRALEEAESAGVRGEAAVEERALAIAEAAVILAERMSAQARARAALEDARARATAADRRRQVAREALERALTARAAVTDTAGTP